MIIFVLGCFVFLSCKDDRELLRKIEASLQRTSSTLAVEAAQEKQKIRSILADEAKLKYSEVGIALDSIDSSYVSTKRILNYLKTAILKENGNQADKTDSIDMAIKLVKESIEKEVHIYGNILNTNGGEYGLKKDEIKKLENKMTITLDSTLLSMASPNEATNALESTLMLAICESELERFHLEILKNLGNLTGGKAIRCYFGIYPVVLPLQNCVKKGKTFRASIVLEPNDLPFSPDDVQLFVDGKPLEFTKGWYVEFEVPDVHKNKTVRISGLIRDEMTGKMLEVFSDVRYEIKVE